MLQTPAAAFQDQNGKERERKPVFLPAAGRITNTHTLTLEGGRLGRDEGAFCDRRGGKKERIRPLQGDIFPVSKLPPKQGFLLLLFLFSFPHLILFKEKPTQPSCWLLLSKWVTGSPAKALNASVRWQTFCLFAHKLWLAEKCQPPPHLPPFPSFLFLKFPAVFSICFFKFVCEVVANDGARARSERCISWRMRAGISVDTHGSLSTDELVFRDEYKS